MRLDVENAPSAVAAEWLARFAEALSASDAAVAASLFHDDGYWRDLLTFTWNIETMEGREAIEAMLGTVLAGVRPSGWTIEGEAKSGR